MLLTEVFDTQEATMLYPVNSLRNFARMQVRTQLLSAIDVDMIISSSLSLDLQQPGRVAELEALAGSRVATVLPAFEPKRQGPLRDHFDLALRRGCAACHNLSKAELETLMERKEVLQFKLKVFPRGHTPTNYTRWFAAQQPYAVAYQRMYEPWFITHWAAMPWFDTNFRGYGLNKIVHVASLNFYNVTFQVHPNAWLVHRPHEDTAVRKVVAREASNVNKLGVRLPKHALYHKVTILFGKAKRAMIRGDYAPRLDDAMVRCFKQLTWLQPFVELQGIPVDADVFL
ncbi:uncharacterized protein HaLaN_11537 [Haematococcus lacustris]|uniref:Uncharacterized protein n=1 Tax=Haematococcus lacustris TaxID=44745 RepID=A0A699Z0L5_HAELA|nr:uncharacterized protein HaLaN_11537 [Haematococcus lacustris]